MARLLLFFTLLPQDTQQVMELRNGSCVDEEMFALFNTFGVGWVSAESHRFISVEKVTEDTGYFRSRGPRELYSSLYSHSELDVLAIKLKE